MRILAALFIVASVPATAQAQNFPDHEIGVAGEPTITVTDMSAVVHPSRVGGGHRPSSIMISRLLVPEFDILQRAWSAPAGAHIVGVSDIANSPSDILASTFHYVVDERGVVQFVRPDAIAISAGTTYFDANSISILVMYQPNSNRGVVEYFYDKLAILVRYLCSHYQIDRLHRRDHTSGQYPRIRVDNGAARGIWGRGQVLEWGQGDNLERRDPEDFPWADFTNLINKPRIPPAILGPGIIADNLVTFPSLFEPFFLPNFNPPVVQTWNVTLSWAAPPSQGDWDVDPNGDGICPPDHSPCLTYGHEPSEYVVRVWKLNFALLFLTPNDRNNFVAFREVHVPGGTTELQLGNLPAGLYAWTVYAVNHYGSTNDMRPEYDVRAGFACFWAYDRNPDPPQLFTYSFGGALTPARNGMSVPARGYIVWPFNFEQSVCRDEWRMAKWDGPRGVWREHGPASGSLPRLGSVMRGVELEGREPGLYKLNVTLYAAPGFSSSTTLLFRIDRR